MVSGVGIYLGVGGSGVLLGRRGVGGGTPSYPAGGWRRPLGLWGASGPPRKLNPMLTPHPPDTTSGLATWTGPAPDGGVLAVEGGEGVLFLIAVRSGDGGGEWSSFLVFECEEVVRGAS